MLSELRETVKIEQTPKLLRLFGYKAWREVKTRRYRGAGGIFEERSIRYLAVPVIASGKYRVMGGPLDGNRVTVMNWAEQNAFDGGFYRLVESEYWGFCDLIENGSFYFWYQGGASHPDYDADAWKYGWKLDWSLRLSSILRRKQPAAS